MIRVNENYLKIQASYLFTEIAHRVKAHQEAHPEAKVIRLGIGDVTRALPAACVAALEKASREMGADATFRGYGPDYGYDTIGTFNIRSLAALLDTLNCEGTLPKTVLYSINPTDNAALGALIGSFQFTSDEAEGLNNPMKIQHGSAWWFNDNKNGMTVQLENLANLSALSKFIGMLTDSRSFLSYTRHEYFRRILCNVIGGYVERGEYPLDIDTLAQTVCDICYNNAKDYFGFNLV